MYYYMHSSSCIILLDRYLSVHMKPMAKAAVAAAGVGVLLCGGCLSGGWRYEGYDGMSLLSVIHCNELEIKGIETASLYPLHTYFAVMNPFLRQRLASHWRGVIAIYEKRRPGRLQKEDARPS